MKLVIKVVLAKTFIVHHGFHFGLLILDFLPKNPLNAIFVAIIHQYGLILNYLLFALNELI